MVNRQINAVKQLKSNKNGKLRNQKNEKGIFWLTKMFWRPSDDIWN